MTKNRRIIRPLIPPRCGEGLRRTKIVATLGPAVDSVDAMASLIEAGADVFRINLSHGGQEDHERIVRSAREASSRLGKDVAIMVDLQGPRLRVGRIRDGSMLLETGSRAVLTSREVMGGDGVGPVTSDTLEEDLSVGVRVLIDDAQIECIVTAIDADGAHVDVVRGVA